MSSIVVCLKHSFVGITNKQKQSITCSVWGHISTRNLQYLITGGHPMSPKHLCTALLPHTLPAPAYMTQMPFQSRSILGGPTRQFWELQWLL